MAGRVRYHPCIDRITCKRCGARPGSYCLTLDNREPKRWPHPVRKADYQALLASERQTSATHST